MSDVSAKEASREIKLSRAVRVRIICVPVNHVVVIEMTREIKLSREQCGCGNGWYLLERHRWP